MSRATMRKGQKRGKVMDPVEPQTALARRLCLLRGLVTPGILTNQPAHAHALHAEYTGTVARREVSALVKHLVIGQLALGIARHHTALAERTGFVQTLRHRNRARALAQTLRMSHHHVQVFQIGQ